MYLPSAKVDPTPSVPKPPKKTKQTRADAAKVKPCKDAARNFVVNKQFLFQFHDDIPGHRFASNYMLLYQLCIDSIMSLNP